MRRIAFINEQGGTCNVITRGLRPRPASEAHGAPPLLRGVPAPRGCRPSPGAAGSPTPTSGPPFL